MDEFTEILRRIQIHFTPGEFIEFLGGGWELLNNSDMFLELVEKNMEDIKEEIGIE